MLPVFANAADFGLVLDQNAGYGGAEDTAFDYQASLVPRLQVLFGDTMDLFVSAGLTASYDDEFNLEPELLRTDFTWHFNNSKLAIGRTQYAGPFGYIAEGLFDGIMFSNFGPSGIISAGAWYTGSLYKKRANIVMTPEDSASFYTPLKFNNFLDTYFASRRIVAALSWEHPSLAGSLRTAFAILGQVDLNGRDNYCHSQYAAAKIGIPVSDFMFELGGAFEIAEIPDDFNIAAAGELGIFWNLPLKFSSQLSLTGFFTSGTASSGPMAAFTPISSKTYGNIIKTKASGISILGLEYIARLHRTFSLDISSSYFIRSDLGTYVDYPADIDDQGEYFLGNEFFGKLIWSPVSDLQFNLGGGVFLPSLGNAAPDRDPKWRMELGLTLTLY